MPRKVTVTLPDDVAEAAQEAAGRYGIAVSAWVRDVAIPRALAGSGAPQTDPAVAAELKRWGTHFSECLRTLRALEKHSYYHGEAGAKLLAGVNEELRAAVSEAREIRAAVERQAS